MPTGHPKSQARVARLKARCLAAAPERRTARINVRVAPKLLAEVAAERALYAVRPSMTEVTVQLLQEGLAFRRLHRSPPRPPRGVPYPISLD
jgi:hypothetical protein